MDLDRRIDEVARPEAPPGHTARVLARSGPIAPARPAPVVPWRWAMPIAATLFVAAGALWQSDRASRLAWFDLPSQATHWSGKGVDLPVLPPEAYWAMSPFEEFDRLQATAPRRVTRTRRVPVRTLKDGPLVWTPRPSTLEPIVFADITPEPLAVEAITDIPPLSVQPIHIGAIEISPLTGAER